jgi:RNA polymerase sporulation-specific sigma factor
VDYNDRELLDYILEGNEDALNILYEKYEPYITNQAKKFYMYALNSGLEVSDLKQEAMIALNEAIHNYNETKDTTFYTYATTCIKRRLISSIISSKRLKHKFLNESVPLDQEGVDGVTVSLDNILINENLDPETVVISIEREKNLFAHLKTILTDFEFQVFELKYNNFQYKEIAKLLDKDSKAIDNALQRIKVKVSKFLEDEKNEEKN